MMYELDELQCDVPDVEECIAALSRAVAKAKAAGTREAFMIAMHEVGGCTVDLSREVRVLYSKAGQQ